MNNCNNTTANSTLAIGGVPSRLDSFVVAESSVLRTNFCAENPPMRQAPNRFGYICFRYIFIGQEEKGKSPQVFQYMLQLQQWGAFGCIAAEVEMKRL